MQINDCIADAILNPPDTYIFYEGFSGSGSLDGVVAEDNKNEPTATYDANLTTKVLGNAETVGKLPTGPAGFCIDIGDTAVGKRFTYKMEQFTGWSGDIGNGIRFVFSTDTDDLSLTSGNSKSIEFRPDDNRIIRYDGGGVNLINVVFDMDNDTLVAIDIVERSGGGYNVIAYADGEVVGTFYNVSYDFTDLTKFGFCNIVTDVTSKIDYMKVEEL